MASKSKMKTMTLLSAIISLLSFGYKLGLGIMTLSIVLMIASISTLMVFASKMLFVRNVTMSREKKKKAYLGMCVASLIYAIIFILFVVLKVNGIDISNQNTYEGVWGALFIGIILIMFVLSLIGLRGALNKTDLMVIGLKEITFISALADLVIIEEFVYRTISEYYSHTVLTAFNDYFPLGVGVLMGMTSLMMFIRYFRYQI